MFQSAAPQGGKVGDGGTKQNVLNLSKQHTDKRGRAARRWLQYRAGVEVLDVRPPTRVARREELQVVAQVTSLTDENAPRRPQISTVASGFLTGWSIEKSCTVGGSRVWRGHNTHGAARRSTRSRLRGCHVARAASKLQVSG